MEVKTVRVAIGDEYALSGPTAQNILVTEAERKVLDRLKDLFFKQANGEGSHERHHRLFHVMDLEESCQHDFHNVGTADAGRTIIKECRYCGAQDEKDVS